MLIDCPVCNARVNGEEIAEAIHHDPSEFMDYTRVCLLRCPSCEKILVSQQEGFLENGERSQTWSGPSRVWPRPENDLPSVVPELVRNAVQEARKCYSAGAYTGCIVMCGRALEGICRSYFPGQKIMLGKGLSKLRENGVIDERLFQWSKALQEHRNLGAHATTHKVSKDDAKDLLEFLLAICEYVYVLTKRFEGFNKRHAEVQDGGQKTPANKTQDAPDDEDESSG